MSVESKQAIRKRLLDYRKSMPAEEVAEKSKKIVDRILATDSYMNSACIFAYVSTRNEVNLKALLEASWLSGKRVAVPRVCGSNMDFYYIESYAGLVKGSFGIYEPADNAVKAEEKDALVLIPGVAYARDGSRIGYGGGYYDRYLAQNNSHHIIAPAYDFQIIAHISTEEHDIRADEIICESDCIISWKND